MRVQFTTIMEHGKKQIFASAICVERIDGERVEVPVASATTGLLDPDQATEKRAAVALLEDLEQKRLELKEILKNMGLL